MISWYASMILVRTCKASRKPRLACSVASMTSCSSTGCPEASSAMAPSAFACRPSRCCIAFCSKSAKGAASPVASIAWPLTADTFCASRCALTAFSSIVQCSARLRPADLEGALRCGLRDIQHRDIRLIRPDSREQIGHLRHHVDVWIRYVAAGIRVRVPRVVHLLRFAGVRDDLGDGYTRRGRLWALCRPEGLRRHDRREHHVGTPVGPAIGRPCILAVGDIAR